MITMIYDYNDIYDNMIIMIITHDSYYSLTTCPVPDSMLKFFISKIPSHRTPRT